MYRLFVALELPENVKHRLAELQCGLPGARWIDPDSLHLTVRFIGEVSPDDAEEIHDALVAVRSPQFQLRFRRFGTFGHSTKAHSLWLGVDPCEDLMRLRGRVDHALSAAGIARESRKYVPHVTLARLRGVADEQLAGFISDLSNAGDMQVEIDQFVLFSSTLTPNGSKYLPVADYPLAAMAL